MRKISTAKGLQNRIVQLLSKSLYPVDCYCVVTCSRFVLVAPFQGYMLERDLFEVLLGDELNNSIAYPLGFYVKDGAVVCYLIKD